MKSGEGEEDGLGEGSSAFGVGFDVPVGNVDSIVDVEQVAVIRRGKRNVSRSMQTDLDQSDRHRWK